MRMAPNPSRRTVKSFPMVNSPAAFAVTLLFCSADLPLIAPSFLSRALLLVIFDRACRAYLCLVLVFSKFPQGAALSQQVPALIQFDLYFPQAAFIIVTQLALCVQTFFFAYKLVDSTQKR